ncbi:lambda exonuclease family protein [Novosphingobium sp. HII-3]|uniref:lambda exonuclease family protein n=1 Tax=Novosphingobium sp. HII-3 TaxID=2075565 RepID=UPI000CDA6D02|nr:lambda exonuclease family protein [Novosphingobium sp. HII-3]
MLEEQRTEDWFANRAGKVTASCIYKVMTKTKSGYGADRANYMAELITERLTGACPGGFTSAAMQWGIDQEPVARAVYAGRIGEAPVEIGFVDHPTIPHCGASPDGLVGFDGLVEIKCPNSATHIATLRGASIDRKYLLQMHWQMACTERDWCDFVSFDPRLPEEMRMHVRRVQRDAELLAEIEAEVTKFLAEVDEAVADLRATYTIKEAA